ncbi:MAG: HD domain-containing protein [Candidatus Eisenbacteria bacterium]|nr:HD domain-containing protein [Candidatus Eisenbacteria bacterium]
MSEQSQTSTGAERAPSAAPDRTETPATEGAQLLRSFFSAWKALALRGTRDRSYGKALSELRQAAERFWAAGEPAQLVRYGRGLMVGRNPVEPRDLLRLQAEVLADELSDRGIGGLRFCEPWEDEQVTRFFQLMQSWRGGADQEGIDRRETLRSEGIASIALEEAITGDQADQERSGWDAEPRLGEARQRAKKTFFRALRSSRTHMRSMAGSSAPQTRRARAVVHEIVDRLLEEEYSILSMTALNDFDEYTFHHCVNVCILSTALGQRLGLGKREVAELGVAAMFHDLGKMSVPEPVLNKPGKFDPQEWELIKRHPLEGVRALLRFEHVNDLVLKIMLAALEHHMRVDLTGYPRIEDAWEVSVLGRIVSIADCYDAMTTKRVYHDRAMHPHEVLQHMLGLRGENFDDRLMRLFIDLMGFFPVGSLVRLSSGEIAVSVAAQPQRPSAPVVRLVRGKQGEAVDPLDLQLVNLAAERDAGNGEGRRIVEPADPEELEIDLSLYLL